MNAQMPSQDPFAPTMSQVFYGSTPGSAVTQPNPVLKGMSPSASVDDEPIQLTLMDRHGPKIIAAVIGVIFIVAVAVIMLWPSDKPADGAKEWGAVPTNATPAAAPKPAK